MAVIMMVIVTQTNTERSSAAGTSGQNLWTCSINHANLGDVLPAIGDVDGDGNKEIIIKSYPGMYCISNIGIIKWYQNSENGPPLLAQADHDAALEIFIFYTNYPKCYLQCIEGINNTVKWRTEIVNPNLEMPLASADIDGNDIAEIIVTKNTNCIICVSGNNGLIRWSSPTTMNLRSPLITDTNGDGITEIIAGSTNGSLTCLDAQNGSVLWSRTLGNTIIAPLAACDIDEDSATDVIVRTGSNRITCVYG
nr:PQQ-binding-like beta-propeller repeat protein [Candidatus Sigynarchaeota archaeon]